MNKTERTKRSVKERSNESLRIETLKNKNNLRRMDQDCTKDVLGFPKVFIFSNIGLKHLVEKKIRGNEAGTQLPGKKTCRAGKDFRMGKMDWSEGCKREDRNKLIFVSFVHSSTSMKLYILGDGAQRRQQGWGCLFSLSFFLLNKHLKTSAQFL